MAQIFENIYLSELIFGPGAPIRSSVRVATTTNGALATAYENGDTIDGVVLATGDRILLKDQTTSSENGIYIVQATGAPVRAPDYDDGESVSTTQIYVTNGTDNAQTTWICTSAPGSDVIGSDNITYEQATGSIAGLSAGAYTNADITVDAQGRVTTVANGTAGAPTNAQYLTLATSAGLSDERVFVPDVGDFSATDGGAGGNYTFALTTTGVVAAQYKIANVTVDTKGRVTAISAASPGTSTTNAIPRWANVTADGLLNSGVLIDGSDNVTGANSVTTPTLNGTTSLTITGGSGAITVSDDTTFSNDVVVSGNLTVNGTTTTVNSETLNVADNRILLNSNYTTTAALQGCIVANYLPTATNDTVAVGGFTAGVVATSNPTVATTGAATFSAGDIILITGANDPTNDGIFEVDTHAANVLTIRGVGTTGTTVGFVQDQFVTDATVAGTITLINVATICSGTDGVWETAAGTSTTGWTPVDLATVTPSYVTVNAEASLPNERVLTAGLGIDITDGGANTTVTISTEARSRAANYDIFPGLAIAPLTSYRRIADFTWDDSQYSTYSDGSLTFYATVAGGRTLSVRLRDVTAGANVVEVTGIGSSGFQRITGFTNPSADAQLELQILRGAGAAPNPRISGVQLAWENST